jgi:hypothetical protein
MEYISYFCVFSLTSTVGNRAATCSYMSACIVYQLRSMSLHALKETLMVNACAA